MISLLIEATLMAENNFKVCFKCGLNLPLSEFYKHPQMADGHLNKCKSCTKNDVHNKYAENMQDDLLREKERARGRDKYHRLYKGLPKEYRLGDRNTRAWFERKQILFWEDIELHHWNYNNPHEVFLLSKNHHAQVHKKISRSANDPVFVSDEGVLLDTREKHEKVIKSIAGNDYFFLTEEIVNSMLS
jgi:hypothetical protein